MSKRFSPYGKRPAGAVRKFKMVPDNLADARSAAYSVYKAKPRNRAPKHAFVKGAIAPFGGRKELKYVDTDLTAGTSVYDTTGLATCVNMLAIGDDNTTRDGRQCTIKSVQIKGSVRYVDGSVESTRCRTMLIWDNANNSASTTSAQLIGAALTATTSYSFPTVDNAQRFTILWDNALSLGQFNNTATISSDGGAHAIVDYYKKLNLVTQYSGTSAAIGSIQNGSPWFVTLGDRAAAAAFQFNGNIRVRFTDD